MSGSSLKANAPRADIQLSGPYGFARVPTNDMETTPGPAPRPRRLLPGSWRRWLVPAVLSITGVGLLLLASAFLVTAGLDDGPDQAEAGSAAPPASEAEQAFEAQTLDLAAAFAGIDANELVDRRHRVSLIGAPNVTKREAKSRLGA